MGETRREALLRELDARLAATDVVLADRYPGPATGRHPVHTVYVPADRYDTSAAATWGEAGAAALAEHGGDDAELAAVLGVPPELVDPVRARVVAKLHREPVEDLRVDFEDGYGRRADAEEDAAATAAGAVLGAARAAREAPPFAGLRCKSLEADTRARAVRTLDLFLESYLAAGGDPGALIVTCPKVSAPEQVSALVALCSGLEAAHGIAAGALRFELQIETPPAVLGADGTATVARACWTRPTTAASRWSTAPTTTPPRSAWRRPSSAVTTPSPSTPRRSCRSRRRTRACGCPTARRTSCPSATTRRSCTPGGCRPGWCGGPCAAGSPRAGTCIPPSFPPGSG